MKKDVILRNFVHVATICDDRTVSVCIDLFITITVFYNLFEEVKN